MTRAPSPDAAAPKRFYWYDLETSGTHPPSDRVMQFAAVATDPALRPVGEPRCDFVALAPDVLPSPQACLVTGITPTVAAAGEDEWRIFNEVEREILQPGTCVVGYNNLRFDDEFLRHGFYRNLIDPYAWSWRDGNSRWDLIDLARAACALRPDGVRWPAADGVPSFRLEDLCAANGIDHEPHNALGDVQATIALARLFRAKQPRLWDYALGHRSRDAARRLLTPFCRKVCVHVSPSYANERRCAAPVVAVARHPDIDTRLIVADLSRDVSPLVEEDADALRARLFATGNGDSPAERPPIKAVVLNRCPFLAPFTAVRVQDAERLGWDAAIIARRQQTLATTPGLAEKIADIYRVDEHEPLGAIDAELALYDGFPEDADRRAADRVREALGSGAPWPPFAPRDKRLRELGARLKARLRDAEADDDERERWRRHVCQCLLEGFGHRPSLTAFRGEVAALAGEADANRQAQLRELAAYADALEAAV